MEFKAQRSNEVFQRDNQNLSVAVEASTIAFTLLATIAVTLRLVSRRLMRVTLGSDDYTAVAGLTLFYGTISQNFASLHYGLGRHASTVSPQDVEVFWKLTYWGLLVYSVDVTVIKLSILLMYNRIFPTRRFRIYLIVVGSITIGWGVATFFATLFNCYPIQYYWDFSIPGGVCISHIPYFISTSVVTILLDIAILTLPISTVVHLQMSRKRKFAISTVFLLGGIVCFTTIIRVYYYAKLSLDDITWTSTNPAIWTAVELGTGIICSCLPVMPALFAKTILQRVGRFFSNSAIAKLFSRTTSSLRTSEQSSRYDTELRGVTDTRLQDYHPLARERFKVDDA